MPSKKIRKRNGKKRQIENVVFSQQADENKTIRPSTVRRRNTTNNNKKKIQRTKIIHNFSHTNTAHITRSIEKPQDLSKVKTAIEREREKRQIQNKLKIEAAAIIF